MEPISLEGFPDGPADWADEEGDLPLDDAPSHDSSSHKDLMNTEDTLSQVYTSPDLITDSLESSLQLYIPDVPLNYLEGIFKLKRSLNEEMHGSKSGKRVRLGRSLL